jgi:regulator of protease activity HflC (stomatin/prohibitin superfamily)
MIRERVTPQVPGLPALFVLLLLLGFAAWRAVAAFRHAEVLGGVAWTVGFALVAVLLGGLFMVNPNEARVLQLFGDYRGTVKTPGLRWANPFFSKRAISVRVRNFESARLKVNDADGNPVEIAAVVVWRVVDTAEACFEVDDYENYVKVQSEAAVRNLATRYPYDAHEEDQTSLRGSTAAVAGDLKAEIQERLSKAGVQAIEARISHLAYAPEIAAAMLQRQQAGAIVAARQRIVDGAVGMVEMALARLSSQRIVELDEERKAAMVSNLLVVLCGERAAQPVVNAGTIYQ